MTRTFCRIIAVSALAGLVAACAATAEQQAQRDDARCAAQGYKPDTKEHGDCVSRLQGSRDVRMQRRHREMVERPAPVYGR